MTATVLCSSVPQSLARKRNQCPGACRGKRPTDVVAPSTKPEIRCAAVVRPGTWRATLPSRLLGRATAAAYSGRRPCACLNHN